MSVKCRESSLRRLPESWTKQKPNSLQLSHLPAEDNLRKSSDADTENGALALRRLSMIPRSAGLGSTTWKNKGGDMEDDLIQPEDDKVRSPRVSLT